jgi:hypothetical protein
MPPQVCGVLDAVLDLVLEKTGFRWQKPILLPDGYIEDVAEVEATPNDAPAGRHDPYGIDDDLGDAYDEEEVSPHSCREADGARVDV